MRIEVINLPAIAEQDEYIDGKLFRKAGEPLCPRLKSLRYLESLRKTMSNWAWRTTMQCDPSQPEGFEWPATCFLEQNVLVPKMPKCRFLVAACDPATGNKPTSKGADFSANVVVGAQPLDASGCIYFDFKIAKTSFVPTLENLVGLILAQERAVDVVGIESNGFQSELRRMAEYRFAQEGIVPPRAVMNTKVDKIQRIRTRLESIVIGGRLRIVDNPSGREALQQFKEFPHPSSHDDAPDVAAIGIELVEVARQLVQQNGMRRRRSVGTHVHGKPRER